MLLLPEVRFSFMHYGAGLLQLCQIFIEFVGPCLLNQRRKSLDVRGQVLQRSLLKTHRWELERDGGDKGERGEKRGQVQNS